MTGLPTIELEAKKDGLQQRQDGTWKLALTVNGEDMAKHMSSIGAAPMGTRYVVVMVERGDDEQPVDRAKEETAKKPRKTESQICGMLCGDGEFFHWVVNREEYGRWLNRTGLPMGLSEAEYVTGFVKWYCGMESRKLLDSDPEGEHTRIWQRLRSQYETDTGRVAEKRR